MSRASKQAHSGRLPFCAARTGAPATAESLAVSMHLASLTAPPTNFSRSTSPRSAESLAVSMHLAAVERALRPTVGVAALRAMPAGILHPGHHPLADHVPDLATGGPRRKGESHAANVFAWR